MELFGSVLIYEGAVTENTARVAVISYFPGFSINQGNNVLSIRALFKRNYILPLFIFNP